MTFDDHHLARRFAALTSEGKREFVKMLSEVDVSLLELPIVCAKNERGQKGMIPMSFAQRSLWLTWQLDPGNSGYNMAGALHFQGQLDNESLLRTVGKLVERHEPLRTRFFANDEGSAYQEILQVEDIHVRLVDLSQYEPDKRADRLRYELQEFSSQAFKLDAEPPFRATLWRVTNEEATLGIALHHIAGDGWSLRLLVEDFLSLYEQERSFGESQLPPLPVQFADYAVWQSYVFEAGERQRQLAYWRDKLATDYPAIELPFDRPRGSGMSRREARQTFVLPPDVSSALKEFARSNDASLFMVVLAMFKVLLHRFSGETVLRVGVPIANRLRRETQKMVAYLTNVVVIETKIEHAGTFRQLLSEVRQSLLEAQSHPDLPFDALVQALQPERQTGVHPLFQVKCTEQDNLPKQWDLDGLSIELIPLLTGDAHFDLSLDFCDRQSGIECVFAFDTSLFDVATIRRFERTFLSLATSLVALPDRQLDEVSAAERIGMARGTHRIFKHATVLEMWDDAVLRVPERIAVRADDGAYTYRDLDHHANRLATQLIHSGAGPDARVGIYADRSCRYVLGVLATLKAGAAFVPLDLHLPSERLKYQMSDSNALIVLAADAPDWNVDVPVVPLSFDALEVTNGRTSVDIHPQQAAYVIYTSGSTGRPKGVVVEHAALANYVQGVITNLDFPDDAIAVAMTSTVAADLGHTSLFGALCSGRTLHLVSAARAFDPDQFASYMRLHDIDVLKIVPGHLQALLHAADPSEVLPRHRLILGGEPTSWSLVDRIAALRPECKIFIHYGPTETTVGVLTHHAGLESKKGKTVPLGGPIANVSASVLDAALAPVPVGVIGELYLSGANVGRGYGKRPGLTAERFVASTVIPGQRMYRTGDRVKTLDDGTLEFVSRADEQVKIRGYRVEPKEVAMAIASLLPESTQVEVIARLNDDGTYRLLAYMATQSGVHVDRGSLLDHAKRVLPDYMVPSALMQLDSIPITANGKVDRALLPEFQQSDRQTFAAPIGDVENTLALIWSQVLRRARVGRYDNFFEIGGDSILALQIISRARKEGLKLLPKQLLELQTIALLGAVVTKNSLTARPSVPAPESQAIAIPLTPIQRWFFEQNFDEPHHWNQSVMLAPSKPLDLGHLRTALNLVVSHHSVLRMRFEHGDRGWGQCIAPLDSWHGLEQVQLHSAMEMAETVDALQQSLTLTSPFKAIWIEIAGRSSRLLLIAHHLVVDTVSWRIILGDLQDAYCQAEAGHMPTLPIIPMTYEAWTDRLLKFAQADLVLAELPYWSGVLGTAEPDLPGRNATDNFVKNQETLHRSLDEAQTEMLLHDTPHAYRTQINDLLLAALARTLCDWGQRDSVLVELEGYGRELPSQELDLSHTAGWFTALFPVRLSRDKSSVGASIKMVKETLRGVPNKGIGFGLLRYLNAAGAGLADHPYPQLTFNYVGQLDQTFGGDTLWQVARESPGAQKARSSRRRTLLETVAAVHRGQLQIAWTYDKTMHSAVEIGHLADRFMEELSTVIEHCVTGAMGVTPSDFPLAKLTQNELDRLPLAWANVQDIYPLSPLQSGLLFHGVLNPAGTAYINQIRIELQGLDVSRFVRVWHLLVQRHEVLRTGFLDADLGLQWVAKSVEVPIRIDDLSGRPHVTAELDELAQSELDRGFDYVTPPLMRLVLAKVAESTHCLIWTRHHLLLDGWSTARLFYELTQLYSGATDLGTCGRYRNFVEWLASRNTDASEQYWRKVVGEVSEPTRLVSTPRNSALASKSGKVRLVLSEDDCRSFRNFARGTHITMSTLVQAAWALFLRRVVGSDTVSYGVTSAGRPSDLPGANEMLGLFISTMPIVIQTKPDMRIGDWLQRLQAQNIASREHEHTSLADIQSWANIQGQSLFDSIVIFENYPLVDKAVAAGESNSLNFVVQRVEDDTSYPMTLSVNDEAMMIVEFAFDTAVFSLSQVENMASDVQQFLRALSNPSHTRICDLNAAVLTDVQRMTKLGTNELRYSRATPIHELIARKAAMQPDATSVICKGHELSYRELDERANAIAHRLLDRGLRIEQRVGIAVERSVEMIVAVLAVLKAGGTYVPLDPAYPQDRLLHIVKDSQISMLLTQERLLQNLPAIPAIELIMIEALNKGTQTSVAPTIHVHGENLAYIIYTSGSTGRPKGVGISHSNLTEHAHVAADFFALNVFDRSLQFSTLNFDGCVEQIFAPLLTGASILMRGPELWDANTFLDQLHTHRITVADLTTAYWTLLVQEFMRIGVCELGCLRQVNVGGEALAPGAIHTWRSAGLGHVKLLNTYGPTEATVTASVLDCTPYVAESKALPLHMGIGQPLPGRSLWVVDNELNPVPVGVIGDLLIGGSLLARGYVGRPGLTAERFVANAFDANGGRLYCTGDRVRWDPDGNLEYVGRSDDQIKIRGFRVELGEIAACLKQLPGITDALAIVRPTATDAHLVGYVCMRHPELFEESSALSTLKTKLPDYMMPTAIIAVDRFEFSANGKINKSALPEPTLTRKPDAAHNETEAALIHLWEQVLGVEGVGRDSNFFSLGGHSLSVLKLRARVLQSLARDLPLASYFEFPTPALLASQLLMASVQSQKDVTDMQTMDSFLDALEK